MREELIFSRYMDNARKQLRALLRPELIAEHAADPLGRHSLDLEHLLVFMRQLPSKDKLVILAEKQDRRFRLFRLSGIRGLPGHIVGSEVFGSEEAALHGAFLQRLKDLDIMENSGDHRA